MPGRGKYPIIFTCCAEYITSVGEKKILRSKASYYKWAKKKFDRFQRWGITCWVERKDDRGTRIILKHTAKDDKNEMSIHNGIK